MNNTKAEILKEVQRRREWLTEWFGEKCDDYCPTCIVCQVWDNMRVFEKYMHLDTEEYND